MRTSSRPSHTSRVRRPGLLAAALALPLACAMPSATTGSDEGSAAESSATTTPRPWTLEDTLRLPRVGDVALSPDGAHALYTTRRLDREANAWTREAWLAPTDGGPARRLPALDDRRGLRFTPDGRRLSFLDDGQVTTLALGGRRPVRVTDHPGGIVRYAWAPDGSRLWFTAEAPRTAEEQAARDAGADAVFVGEDGNGLDAARWTDLWVLDLATDESERVADLELTIESLDVAPDGRRVAFVGLPDNRTNHFHRAELYALDQRNRMPIRLTRNDAPEASPRWSPDGARIAFQAPDDEAFDLRNGWLWVVDPLTGDARRLEGQREGELGLFAWTPDGRALRFVESRGLHTNLYELDVATDAVRALSQGPGTLRARAVSEDGATVLYTRGDHGTPEDLWAGRLGASGVLSEPTRLTDVAPWVGTEVAVAPARPIHWSSTDGRPIEGVLTLPPGFTAGDPAPPLVVDIHGGPPGFWGDQLEAEHQLLAAHGYAVLAPNPRGSSSYGDDHLRALMGDVGGGEYEDLMTGVDHVVALGLADPERLAVRGWSWGGILGAWTLTRTDRFRAAALGAMVGDWAAEVGGGLMYDLRHHYIGGEPWVDREEWDRRSAQTYVTSVVTPTLLLHGEDDDVSTLAQSQRFYAALRARGVPVRFLRFPRQGHGIDEPALYEQQLTAELDWFARHVLGERPRPEAPVAAPDRAWLAPGRELSAEELALTEAMEAAGVPGLSAVVLRGGRPAWSCALGWADAEARRPVTGDTLFQLASISKTVTATVVLQLVERGALDLDAPLEDVLPFRVRHPAHPEVALTARMLLTHSAGLRDNWITLEGTWVLDGDYPLSLRASIEAYFLPDGALYSAARNFQPWAPGERHAYANVGFALLALVAEEAAGAPFERLVREGVLGPLGIEGGFRLAEVDLERTAVPTERDAATGAFRGLGHHAYLDFASGTLRVSAPGLARFLAAWHAGGALDGARVLDEATVAEALTVQDPALDDGQGLAWYTTTLDGRTFWGHDGGDPGVSTQLLLDRATGDGVVLLLNGDARRRAEADLLGALLGIATER